MMPNGFRQQPKSSTKDKFQSFEVELKNSQMASRVTQMMVQQILQNNKSMGADISKLFQMFNELQYKVLAYQEITGADQAKLQEVATRLRLKDFNEASDSEDAAQGFTVVDTVTEDSTVLLTSTTQGTDQGIFRSRVKLTDTGSPELIQGLMGKTVGTKVSVKLNGIDHEVELLGVRQPRPETAEEAAAVFEEAAKAETLN